MMCISNEVGGQYMSSALWEGIPLADLLARGGAIQPGATKVVLYATDDSSLKSFRANNAACVPHEWCNATTGTWLSITLVGPWHLWDEARQMDYPYRGGEHRFSGLLAATRVERSRTNTADFAY